VTTLERKRYEEFAYVLDYLPQGKPRSTMQSFRAEPIVQLLGEDYFTLLEAVVNTGAVLNSRERVYVGKSATRTKISHILGRTNYEELTSEAKNELLSVVEEIAKNHEKRFTDFFNEAQAVTPRMHSLELLPGIGKKYMWAILKEREKKTFENYKDIQTRTQIPDPVKMVAKRVKQELSEEPKYKIFVR
jgi:putative nucleotide binding protein